MSGKTLVGALRVTLGLDSTQFTTGVSTAQESMRRFGGQMQRLGAVVSLAGTAVVAGVRSQINAADEMAKASSRFGVPIRDLSALAHAGNLADVSLDQLGTGLQQMSRRMASAPKVFEDLGIAVRDADGAMRPTRAILEDLADVFAGMPDGAEKTALAMQTMGRSGATLIPMLNGGSAALREMAAEAEAMGLVFDEETGRSAEQFNDNLTRLSLTLTGLWRQIASNVAPVLAQMSEWLISATRAFQSLSPETQKFISIVAVGTVALGPLLIGLGLLVSLLSAVSAPVLAVTAAVVGATAAWAAWGGELAKVPGNLAIIMDYYLPGVRDAMAGALATVGELGAAFLDLNARALVAVIQHLMDVGRAAVQTADILRNGTAAAVEWVKVKFGELIEFIRTLPAQLVQVGRDMMAGLAGGIAEGWGAVVSAIRGGNRQAAEAFKEDWMIQSPSRVTHAMGVNISEGLANGIAEGQSMVGSAMTGLTDVAVGASQGLQQVGSQLTDMFAGAFSSILTGSQSAGDAISGLLRQLAQMAANAAFKQLFSGFFGGGVGQGLGKFLGIGGYATGTMSAARGLALVGEQGPELVDFRGGERVFNARETAGMMAGGPPNVEVKLNNINVFDPGLVGDYLSDPSSDRVFLNKLRRLGIAGA